MVHEGALDPAVIAGSRQPLDAAGLNQTLPSPWQVEAVSETGSTNADLLVAAAAGAPHGRVLTAEYQTGGRGRLDRSWTSPPGAGLIVSILLRPDVPAHTWAWLPLLTGLAVADAVGGDARLKWPNDVLLGPSGDDAGGRPRPGAGKIAGILVQTGSAAAVVGIGLNVSATAEELPVDTATSLALQGRADLDRGALLTAILHRLGDVWTRWQATDGDAEAAGLANRYRRACSTIGAQVSIELATGVVLGEAAGVGHDGRLIVRTDDATVAFAAGDVTHLRPRSR